MSALPRGFVDRLVDVLGSRERLDALLDRDSRRAVRVNRLKTTPRVIQERFDALGFPLEAVPWSQEAFFVDEDEDEERALGHVFEHQAGLVFVQAPVSTLPVQALDPQPGQRVLDLSAAPGGKATHIAERLDGEGLVVANDVHPGRVNNLISNLDQAGVTNAAVTRYDACRLAWPITFDKVLVDAPCSTLGSMHESWDPIRRFTMDRAHGFAGTQRSLLKSAFHATREGGTIVYATCTLEPVENEAVVAWFLDTFPVQIEPFDPGIGQEGRSHVAGERYDSGVEDARLVFGDEVESESFFVARFEKLEDAPFPDPRTPPPRNEEMTPTGKDPIATLKEAYGLTHPFLDTMHAFETPSRWYGFTGPSSEEAARLVPDRAGLYVATPEEQGPRLSFEAATMLGHDAQATIELTPDQARAWLAGNSVDFGMGHDVPDRFDVVTCHGEPIGCARPFGTKLPCYVPKRNRVPEGENLVGFLAVEG